MYACVHNLKEEIVYAVRIQLEKGNSLRVAETLVRRLFQQANNRFLYMESLLQKDIIIN